MTIPPLKNRKLRIIALFATFHLTFSCDYRIFLPSAAEDAQQIAAASDGKNAMPFDLISPALETDLAKVAEGWSAKTFITKRAVAIREAIAAGDTAEAERLALEIEQLQGPATSPAGRAVWALSAERWAEYLIHAYARPRFFYPRYDCTADAALAEAHRVFFVRPSSGTKFIKAADIAPVEGVTA